jgi:hypothetical protein
VAQQCNEDEQIDACLDLSVSSTLCHISPRSSRSLLPDQSSQRWISSQPKQPASRASRLCWLQQGGDSGMTHLLYRSRATSYDPPYLDTTLWQQHASSSRINDAFTRYLDLYFEGSTVSVYGTWTRDLPQLSCSRRRRHPAAIHVIEAIPRTRQIHITSSRPRLFSLGARKRATGCVCDAPNEHDGSEETVVVWLGIVEIEDTCVRALTEVYFGKTMDITGGLRGLLCRNGSKTSLHRGLSNKLYY